MPTPETDTKPFAATAINVTTPPPKDEEDAAKAAIVRQQLEEWKAGHEAHIVHGGPAFTVGVHNNAA